MRANLKKALDYIFTAEGGFAERATEPGGGVNMGISMQTLRTWRKAKAQVEPTMAELRELPHWEALEIYQTYYAAPIRFDDLASGVDYCALDAAVNEGGAAAIMFLADAAGLQRTVLHTVTGALVRAANERPASVVIDHMCDARLAAKKKRPQWAQFGRGWTNRIEAVRTHAKEMAAAVKAA